MSEQIVILDGATLNPGDLDWSPLQQLGSCAIYPRTAREEIIGRVGSAGIVLTNKVALDREILASLPTVRYIGVLATGYNIVDTVAAQERGITVTNVPGYSTPSVVQMTFALLFELASQAGRHAALTRAGRWSAAPDFCFWENPLTELAGLTLGIVGYGTIGRGVARVADALDMQVLVHTRSPQQASDRHCVELDPLLTASDVVSLHCPLTDATRHLLDARRLELMKPEAFLLNTARGPLIDEDALAAALNSGALAGAGLDVLSCEPPPATHPLLQARNCLVTPHIAWASRAARSRLLATVAANVEAFLQGKPQNRVV